MAAAVSAQGLSKRFGSVQALDGVSIEFFPGEVHAVLGENGAGKSTLMSILSGFVTPDEGRIQIRGEAFPVGKPHKVRAQGIAMVHQHFTLVPEFTVEENLALAQLPGLGMSISVEALSAKALEWSKRLGWDVPPKERAGDLPVGVRQRLEVLKALATDADVLLFDEPTAALSPTEADALMAVLRTLAAGGKAVILIAHKLREVRQAADRITVLRKGRFVAAAPMAECTDEQIAEWMVGGVPPLRSVTPAAPGASVARLEAVSTRGDRGSLALSDVTLELRAGEITGFAGVEGNGQEELAEVLAGVRAIESGSLEIRAKRCSFVPGDRSTAGTAKSMSILENLQIGALGQPALTRGLFWRGRELLAWALEQVRRHSIKIGRLSDPVSSLSGGNQQKVVMARCLAFQPDLLVVMNPTRGLDIGANQFVWELLREQAQRGAAVALFSTDWDEIAELSHRVLAVSGGRVSESATGAALFGGSE